MLYQPHIQDKSITTLKMEEAIRRVQSWIPGTPLDLSNLDLITLPVIPEGIERLYCSYNNLSSLSDNLPSSLTYLSCYYNKLQSLPENLPSSLTYLYCMNNELITIPETLPSSLYWLDCKDNKIKNLPKKFPDSINILDLRNNEITSLPETLPKNLYSFYCSNNKIRYLPQNIPISLEILFCENNNISYLPELNCPLKNLWCENNELKTLPTYLSNKLRSLKVHNNYFPNIENNESIQSYHLRILDYFKKNTFDKTKTYKEELIEKAWHPDRVTKWIEAGYDLTDL